MSYVSNSLGSGMLAGQTGLPGAFCRSTPAPLADLLSFSNRETGNARLGASKVPQPSVDLIYMAASARSLTTGRSVSTAEFEVPTLSCSVLVWNSGGGVAIKEAGKEWHPTKNMLCVCRVSHDIYLVYVVYKRGSKFRIRSRYEMSSTYSIH